MKAFLAETLSEKIKCSAIEMNFFLLKMDNFEMSSSCHLEQFIVKKNQIDATADLLSAQNK